MLKSTTDVWFATFLKKRKRLPLHSFEVIARGKVRCYFEISDEDWNSYKTEFSNSELPDIKSGIQEIKDLGY